MVYSKKYYQDNKEKINRQNNKYYSNNKEKIAKKNKQRYQDNKEKLKAISRRYYQDNKEKCNAYQKEWRKKNKDNLKGYYLNRHYGISLEEYNIIFEKQEGCCAICGKCQSELQVSLSVDHNHDTGAVRGLLCRRCNIVIGYFNEDVERLTSAIEYLEQYN